MHSIAVCTVIALNYSAFGAVLVESFRKRHPDTPFYMLIADDPGSVDRHDTAAMHSVTLDEIDKPGLRNLLFRYELKQVVVALKPAIIRHLLRDGYETVVYMDADMLVLAELAELFETVSSHPVSLTPHLVSIKIDRERFRKEQQLLLTGIYNAGFVGVTNCAEAHRFLAWWDARLQEWCIDDLQRGFHDDQRWLDLAPAFFKGIYLHREYDWNLAYWNLPDVTLSAGDESAPLHVNGVPCKIFHFSGYDLEEPRTLSRYGGALEAGKSEYIAPLLEFYADALRRHGVEQTRQIPWRWDRFSNGVRISPCVRQVFVSLGPGMQAFPDPFDTELPGSFYHWLLEPAVPRGLESGPRISRLWQLLHDQHADLQAQFPMQDASAVKAFAEWTLTKGLDRFDLPEEFALTRSNA